jgi:hypothetical protein
MRYYDVDVHVTPPSAALLLDGRHVAVGRYVTRLPQDGSGHELRVVADSYLTRSVNFRDEPPPRYISLTPSAPEPALEAEPMAKAPLRSSTSEQARARAMTRPLRASADASTAQEVPHAAPRVAVIERQRPKVRIVDEVEPRVRVIE